MGILSIGANLKTLQFYRNSNAKSATGAVSSTWSIQSTITEIDLQPASNEVLRTLEGSRESVRYQCFVAGADHDIKTGDRVVDPKGSSTKPELEVFNLQEWPSVSLIPAHTEFLLRKIGT